MQNAFKVTDNRNIHDILAAYDWQLGISTLKESTGVFCRFFNSNFNRK